MRRPRSRRRRCATAGLGPVAIVPISTAGDRDRRSAFSELGGARRVLQGARGRARSRGGSTSPCTRPRISRPTRRPGLALAAVLPRADARDAWCGPHGEPRGRAAGRARRAPPRCAAARSCARCGPTCASRACAATSTRACASASSAASTASCSRPAGSIASTSRTRSASASRWTRCCPRPGQGFLALQARSEDAAALAAVGDAEAARVLLAERPCAALLGGGCRAPGRHARGRRWPTGGSGCAPGWRCRTARSSSRRTARGRRSRGARRRGRRGGARARGRGDRRGGARVTVYLVGAGPGDPGLITARGAGAPAARRRDRLRPPRGRRAARPRAGRTAC